MKKLVFLSFLWVQLLLLVCFIKLLSLSSKTCLISLGLHGFHLEVEAFLKTLSAVNLRRLTLLVNSVGLWLYFNMCAVCACVRGRVCACKRTPGKWIIRRMLTWSLSSPSLLMYNYYIIKYAHLKCTVWYILIYACTYETSVLTKILNIFIAHRSFILPTVIPPLCLPTSSQKTTDLLSVPTDSFAFLENYINSISSYVSFC